ncbi:MAG: pantoate--beta-alanine ligase [Bacteroidota bacterium]|nr:pantoate--beta-alanine ligase [Bacteroidota bacterium]
MPQLYTQAVDLQQVLSSEKEKNHTVGFVPTMGALHRGHLSLMERARRENDIVVCSIFVNPTQFNNVLDFARYPRSLEEDMLTLRKDAPDYLFAPSEEEMYPRGQHKTIDYLPDELGRRLEGEFRPGHFEGMAAVVKRFFDLVKPDRAYFGQKDYQQCLIVKDMARYFGLALDVIMCPTLREESGLAMSSRNALLSTEERKKASIIYRELKNAVVQLHEGHGVEAIKAAARNTLAQEGGYAIDYFDICNANDLSQVREWNGKDKILVCTAVHSGHVRLIDNILAG